MGEAVAVDGQLKLELPKVVNGASERVLQVLADSSGIDLTINSMGSVFGDGKISYKNASLMLTGVMDVRVVSSFLLPNGEDVGIILHISGNLYVYLFASDFDLTVRALLLDVSKSKDSSKRLHCFFETNGVRSWKGSLKAVESMVVDQYERGFDDTVWAKSGLV